jgi:hypothetical protein
MQRRRRTDHIAQQIIEFETRLATLSEFAAAHDSSAAEEIKAILDLLPHYREALRKEEAQRRKYDAAKIKAS